MSEAVVTASAAVVDPPSDFRRRLLRWDLFVIPIAYLMRPLGALIHEVLGHGLVAWLHGGTIRWFFLTPWGDGGIDARAPGFEVMVLVAGAVAEAAWGLIALLAAGRLVRGGAWRVGLLLASMTLLESACFVLLLGGFREAIPSAAPGAMAGTDFARVAAHFGDPGLRLWFANIGAAGFIAVALAFARVLAREAEASLAPSVPGRGWPRATMILLFVCVPGFWWFRGAGFLEVGLLSGSACLPLSLVSIVHPVLAALLILGRGRAANASPPDPPGLSAIFVPWCIAGLLLLGSLCLWRPPEIFR